MSPNKAAHIANVSRRTIMRAIENKEIIALRDNRNCWKIDHAELEKWASAHCALNDHAHIETPPLPTSEIVDLRNRLAAESARADIAEALRTAAETDRDRWRTMVEKLAERPRRNWWPWSR